jgi:hypothetical protein
MNYYLEEGNNGAKKKENRKQKTEWKKELKMQKRK